MKCLLACLSTLFFLTGCFVPKQHFSPESPWFFKANPLLPSSLSSGEEHLVRVAVFDSGVDYTHPKLQRHLRLNSDQSGVGLDLLGEDGLPFPSTLDPKNGEEIEDLFGMNEHGTHVASLALVGGSLELPEAGGQRVDIGPRLGLIPVRVLPLDDEGMDSDDKIKNDRLTVEKLVNVLTLAIDFALLERAHVANLSLGIDPTSLDPEVLPYLKQLVQTKLYPKMHEDAREILFLFAAGNESVPVVEGNYPAALKASNMLTIGALDNHTRVADYSNTGALVDVYIRGTDIQGYLPGGNRGKLSGTSMATPLVANLAAKMKLMAPCLTALELRQLILDNAGNLETAGQNVKVVRFRETLAAVRALPGKFKQLDCRK